MFAVIQYQPLNFLIGLGPDAIRYGGDKVFSTIGGRNNADKRACRLDRAHNVVIAGRRPADQLFCFAANFNPAKTCALLRVDSELAKQGLSADGATKNLAHLTARQGQ